MAATSEALRRAAQRILQGGASGGTGAASGGGGGAIAAAARATAAAAAGQPTPGTHPELLQPGQLLPGMAAAEFAARRRQLAAMLPAGAMAVLPATPLVYMAGVIPYPYRPGADFLYLTGVAQPYAVAVLDANRQYSLFVADPDAWREQWDGQRLSPEAALKVFGADQAFPLSMVGVRCGAAGHVSAGWLLLRPSNRSQQLQADAHQAVEHCSNCPLPAT
jgi:hypothetical protein